MDENENKMQEQQEQVDTATTETEVVDTPKDTTETNNDGTTNFTQEQVNNIVRERLERERNKIFTRYGVKDRNELDDKMGKALAYEIIKEDHDNLTNQYNDLVRKYAYLENGVNNDKIGDIEAYFKGKELVLNSETLQQELATHPEWKKQDKNITTIEKISPDREAKHTETEREKAMKLFGF